MPGRDPRTTEDTPSIYMPYGAGGGGGQGGNYVFTDLAHLDRIITKWIKIRDDLLIDHDTIRTAIQVIAPPADDRASIMQAKAARASLVKGQQHNQAMVDYVDSYIEKLHKTRAQYASTEGSNADQLRNADRQR